MTIGEQIRSVRKHAGLTQRELGNLSGTSETTIKQYELGKRQPRIEQLKKIAKALEVDIDHLLGFDKAFITNSQKEPIKKIIAHIDSIGYTFRTDSEGNAWIKYPDGKTIDISQDELDSLSDETDTYLKFRLEELRKKKLK